MDKKNTIIGVLLLVAAFYFMFDSSKQEAKRAQIAHASQTAQVSDAKKASAATFAPKTSAAKFDEIFTTIRNDDLELVLTNRGGAIAKAKLSKYPISEDNSSPYVFNDVKDSFGIMTVALDDAGSAMPDPVSEKFELVSSSPTGATYRARVGNLEISRTYALSNKRDDYGSAEYSVNVKTSVKNVSDSPIKLGKVFLFMGAVPPTASDVYGNNLAVLAYDAEGGAHFSRASAFVDSSGFLGIGASRAKNFEKLSPESGVRWGSVKNQFFASVFTPENTNAAETVAYPIAVNASSSEKYMKNALAGFIGFTCPEIAAGQTFEIDGNCYIGPKELDRLFGLGAHQEEVMNYGWFGFVSRPLSRLMNWIHSWVSVVSPDWGWGWSIIILTLIVRLILWPLTSIQIKTSQRMAKIQEPVKALREKYKDDPKRLQQETMKIYSEYGINPMAGCLPVLIQLPIFIGLYYMLQTSCEIRFAHFLWIKDLSLPDTVEWLPSVFGIPVHILPLLNAFVTFLQMHLTPTPSADKSQAMMFKLMPFIMLLFFYVFPSGLVLYWLVQSVLGIIQAIIVRRGKDKVVLKKRTKPSFMQKLQAAMEEAQAAQNARGEAFQKLPLKEKLRIAREDAMRKRKAARNEALKGTMYEQRKKNPGGRSTKPKR